ncbi:MAG: T9SS type A sorting domain-containing protein [Bacteroidales bacterium]|nr:T9SS type A sorting domain-containing protein [Bacteroidales bacterium]
MKKILFSGLLIFVTSVLYCQISINRSDVYNSGDEFPRIYYAFEIAENSCHIDSVMNDSLVFDDLNFPLIEIDTLVYKSPSETDPTGIYQDATCSFPTRDGFTMYMLIDEQQMKLVGFQGELPMIDVPMNLVFTDTLIMSNFPCDFDDHHGDTGLASEKQHISVFQSLIGDSYSLLSMMYDTVKFKMNTEINVDYDEFGTMQCVGDSNLNGRFNYLRESRQLITTFDIELRSKQTGNYTPLNNSPFIPVDQLPVDLPIVDTTTSYSYWTKDNKNPMVEIEMNTGRDSVHNVTYRYAYLSSAPSFEMLKHNVYPNPAANYFIVNIPDFNNQTLEIYSIAGKKIRNVLLSSQSSKIDITDISNGTYIYKIMDKNNYVVAGGKFVKQ